MRNVVVAVKMIAPVRARFPVVAGKRTAAVPPSPHIGMRGIPIRERPFQQPFALGPRRFFRHAHQHRLPARSLPYCHDDSILVMRFVSPLGAAASWMECEAGCVVLYD